MWWRCKSSQWPLCLRVPPLCHEHSLERCSPHRPRFAQTGTPGAPPCPQARSTAVRLHHFPYKQAPGLSDHQMREHVAGWRAAGVPWVTYCRCPTPHSRPHPGTPICRVPLGFGTCALGRRCGGWCFLKPHQKSPSHHSMSLLIHSLLREWCSIF